MSSRHDTAASPVEGGAAPGRPPGDTVSKTSKLSKGSKGSKGSGAKADPIELPSTFLPGQAETQPGEGAPGSKAPAPVPPSSQQPDDGSNPTQTLLDYLLGG